MFIPCDGLALDERDSVFALGEDAVLGDGGKQLALPRPLQRAPLVRDDLGAAVIGHHCAREEPILTTWSFWICVGKSAA